MKETRDSKEAVMRKTLHILARITGSAVGLLLGGVLLFWGCCALIARTTNDNEDAALAGAIILGPVAFLAGSPLGAAVGATIVQRILRERGSFWRALLGAALGWLIGVMPTALCLWTLYRLGVWHDGWWPFLMGVSAACAAITVGAVIGSGWGAMPADAAEART
jgi:hypothetical protein